MQGVQFMAEFLDIGRKKGINQDFYFLRLLLKLVHGSSQPWTTVDLNVKKWKVSRSSAQLGFVMGELEIQWSNLLKSVENRVGQNRNVIYF